MKENNLSKFYSISIYHVIIGRSMHSCHYQNDKEESMKMKTKTITKIGIFIIIIAVISFPLNDVFLEMLSYPYGNYLFSTLGIRLIGTVM